MTLSESINAVIASINYTITDAVQQAANAIRVQQISDAYLSVLGREVDQTGLHDWSVSTLTIKEIYKGLIMSPEYATNRMTLTRLYVDILRRQPDAGGFADWTNSGWPLSAIRDAFFASAEYAGTVVP